MTNTKKQILAIVAAVVVLVALIASAAVAAYAFTDGFKTFEKVALYYGDKVYTTAGGEVSLPLTGDALFTLGGAGFEKEDRAFSVQITANKNEDFLFGLGDELKKFSDVTDDLTPCFDIEKGENSFIIHAKEKPYTVAQVLSDHFQKTVTPVSTLDENTYFFTLTVRVDGAEPIVLSLRQLQRIPVENLNPSWGTDVYF